jgi:LysM domain
MKSLRLLVPVSVIAAVVLLLVAPAGALAAPMQHGGENQGWHNNWDDEWNNDQNDNWNDGWHNDQNGHGDDDWDNGWNCGFTYIVKCGDTLGNIAWRFGVNSTYLAQVNGLWNPNRIYAGQALWIPSGGCW